MNIGEPRREIYIEPLELPEPLRQEPTTEPVEQPEHAEPERVNK